ncbi:hypothetical protein FBU31_004513, partial [Coemansia sp. 'formosensis']
MSRNPFEDHDDDDLFAEDPFSDSHTTAARQNHGSTRVLVDDDQDAVPLHSVRRSEDAGGFLSGVGLSGARAGSYAPVGADTDPHTGYAKRGMFGDNNSGVTK